MMCSCCSSLATGFNLYYVVRTIHSRRPTLPLAEFINKRSSTSKFETRTFTIAEIAIHFVDQFRPPTLMCKTYRYKDPVCRHEWLKLHKPCRECPIHGSDLPKKNCPKCFHLLSCPDFRHGTYHPMSKFPPNGGTPAAESCPRCDWHGNYDMREFRMIEGIHKGVAPVPRHVRHELRSAVRKTHAVRTPTMVCMCSVM